MPDPNSTIVGTVHERETCEGREFEWIITDSSSLINLKYWWYNSVNFYFADDLFHFRMYPRSRKPGWTGFYLLRENLARSPVEYNIGMKKLDGSVKHLKRGILKETSERFSSSEVCFPMKLSDLQQILTNELAFICTLKHHGTTFITQSNMLGRPKFKKVINLSELSQNFKSLFADKESCDTTLRVKEKEFKAHKAILMARSSVFFAMFHNDMSEKQSSIVNISDCNSSSFQEFLEYLYCGQLEDMSFSTAFDLYSTSEKYNVQDLKAFCAECLGQSLTIENMCTVVAMADMYDDKKLFSAAQLFFNRNAYKILDTTEWECLLETNYHVAKKLLKGMSSKVKIED